MTFRVLAVGDVCGRPGLDFLRRSLSAVKKTYRIDFTVVNGENGAFSVDIEKLSWNVLRFKY